MEVVQLLQGFVSCIFRSFSYSAYGFLFLVSFNSLYVCFSLGAPFLVVGFPFLVKFRQFRCWIFDSMKFQILCF